MDKKIILYIAISLDGFIAKEDGNLDWLTGYENSGEDYGFKELYNRIGTILVGGTTYRQIEDPYKGKQAYVFTRKEPKQKADNIHFVSGDVKEVFNNLKLGNNRNIWLVGGADLVNQFLNANLIDEYIITIIPTLLGKGISLFQGRNPEINLELLNVKSYDSGLVQLHYVKRA
jgi:dihydrofolate reductase